MTASIVLRRSCPDADHRGGSTYLPDTTRPLIVRSSSILEDRTGTLEKGKDADFVILSGDPFSVYTRVQQTWVEGQKRFDLEDADDAAVANGGYGALVPSTVVHIHGYGEYAND